MRTLLTILLTLALVSCGPDSKHTAIDGKLLNLNQGEFVVYSPDGALPGTDTLRVEGGRFALETECERPGTLVILLPGGQEIPVFVRPGKGYTLSGDAQNLRELSVKGGDDNRLMSQFRLATMPQAGGPGAAASPAAMKKAVADIATAHPASAVALYLVGRYLLGAEPDYALALRLLTAMRRERGDDAAVEVLESRVRELLNASPGHSVPSFTATDTEGRQITQRDLATGSWVVATCAAWDFESTSQVRRILSTRQETSARWRVLAISMDATAAECRSSLSNVPSPEALRTVCDGQMSSAALAARLAMPQTGQTLIVSGGRITARNLSGEKLYERLRKGL